MCKGIATNIHVNNLSCTVICFGTLTEQNTIIIWTCMIEIEMCMAALTHFDWHNFFFLQVFVMQNLLKCLTLCMQIGYAVRATGLVMFLKFKHKPKAHQDQSILVCAPKPIEVLLTLGIGLDCISMNVVSNSSKIIPVIYMGQRWNPAILTQDHVCQRRKALKVCKRNLVASDCSEQDLSTASEITAKCSLFLSSFVDKLCSSVAP